MSFINVRFGAVRTRSEAETNLARFVYLVRVGGGGGRPSRAH